MIKQVLAGLALAATASTAHAGFVTIDSVAVNAGLSNTDVSAQTVEIVAGNQFKSALDAIGVKTYTHGVSLAVSGPGTIEFRYFGKEAGFRNTFSATGAAGTSAFYDTGFSPTVQNHFGSGGTLIGTIQVAGGATTPLNFEFCAFSSSKAEGCLTNAANDALNIFARQSITFSVSEYTTWIYWDDSGAGPDDNHDDFVLRAVFTPDRVVPEPATLALFGIGLLGLGIGARRKRA